MHINNSYGERGNRGGGGSKGGWGLITLIIVLVLLAAPTVYTYLPQIFGQKPASGINVGPTSTIVTASGVAAPSCSSATAWTVKQSELAYGSDALAGTVAINGFSIATPPVPGQSQQPNFAVSDLTSTSTPATSTGLYAPIGTNLFEYTETSTVLTYPIYAPFTAAGTVPSVATPIYSVSVLTSAAGAVTSLPLVTIQCAPSSSNANANIWNVIATPIQAPTSGTSALTNTKALCISSAGLVLNGGGHASDASYPTTSQLFTCNLNILQTYRGVVGSVPVFGTQANPVQNYATGQVITGGTSSVNFNLVALVLSNRTGVQMALDPSAYSGLSLTPITTNLLASSTKAWIVTGFPGCAPAPGSTSSTSVWTCASLPLDTYDTTGGTNHAGVDVVFVDGQQPAYLLANLVTGAQNSFTLSGSGASTTNTGFSSGLTPTTGNDAGAFAALIKQSYGIVMIG